MRVLQLISTNGFYGAEGVVVSLAKELKVLGCDVSVGVFNAGEGGAEQFLSALGGHGIPVEDLECSGRMDIRTIRQIIHVIREQQIDVLHTHGYKTNFYGLAAARLAPCRVVATCHNWTESTSALKLYATLDKWLLRFFDAVAVVSDGVQSSLGKSRGPLNDSVVVENGTDIATARRPIHEIVDPMIGAVTRLSTEKGVDVLIRALPAILQRYPTIRCVVVGEGPERKRLMCLAASLKVAHALDLPGFCSDIPGFLSRCRIVAHPSRIDGLPLAILEAMAAQKAIVASAVGSIPKLLQSGNNGLLVPPDDPDSLAASILMLLDDPVLANHLATNAYSAVQAHSSASMARKYLALYEGLDASRNKTAKDTVTTPVRS